MARLKSAAKKLGLLSGGVIVALLLAELGLILIGVPYRPRVSQTDYYRGRAYPPGVEWEQSNEGRAYVKINSDGFRDKDRPTEKPPATLRIAVLGDSYVDALQVPVEERFTELLQSGLKSRGAFRGADVEVLNFGRYGYGTAQELLTLRHCVWKYAPDIVVLAFLPNNDVRNNYEPLQHDPGRPYFVLRDGELVLDASFRSRPQHKGSWWRTVGYQIVNRSRLAQLVYHGRRSRERRTDLAERDERGGKYARAAGLVEVGLDAHVFRAPEHPDWQAAWRVTEELIKKMNSEVRQGGARFLVVTLTSSTQVHPNPDVRTELANCLEVDDLFYPDERIKTLGQKEGFPVVNLCYPFLEHARTHGAFLHGFFNTAQGRGHWNAQGHRLAAGVLVSEVVRLFDGP